MSSINRSLIFHSENKCSTKVRFKRDVQSLLEELGNPFEGNSGDLISLCSKAICNPSFLSTVKEIESIGRKQLKQFIEERLTSQTNNIMDALSRNKSLQGSNASNWTKQNSWFKK